MTAIAGGETASFLNAFTYFLSGILFEMLDEPERAIIDLRKALEVQPNNTHIRDALDRARNPARYQDQSRIVVIYSDGLVIPRQSIHIPFFYDTSVLQIVMPYYSSRLVPRPQPLRIRTGSHGIHETQVITDLNAMAAKALSEQYLAIFVRQVLRLIAKRKIQKEAEQVNPWLGFAANIFNIVTDRADQRNWLTLPGYLQVAAVHLHPGEHQLFWGTKSLSEQSVNLNLEPGETIFVIVDRIGNTFYTHTVRPQSP